MKTQLEKMNFKIRYFMLSIISVGLILSCASSPTQIAGVGGTGITTSGIITGFGSIFVNGIKFEINEVNTSFDVDGDIGADQSNLRIGMLVTIRGTVNADGVTGTAESLVYDDDIEGPINSAPIFIVGSDGQQKQLSILGFTIIVDAFSTHYDGIRYETLAENDVVEISGYSSGTNTIVATLVKKTDIFIPDFTQVELKGVVSNLTITHFNLNNIVINYSLGTELDLDESQLIDGMFVEVKGVLLSDGSITADKIEQEGDGFSAEDGKISLSGGISDFVDDSNFKINGQLIDVSLAQELSPINALDLLGDGVSVEVEGSIVNSVLIADKIEVKLNNIKIKALVESVSINGLSVFFAENIVGVIDIVTNNATKFEDERDEISSFSLSDIAPADYIEIEATLIDGQIIASQIEREEPEEFVLQGQLDSVVADTRLTILGITYAVNSSTDYDGFDNASDFFSSVNLGDIIRIKDDDNDGIADEVKLDD